MKNWLTAIFFCLSFALEPKVYAADPAPAKVPDIATATQAEASTDWAGLGFGLGVAYAGYSKRNIESAGVYNGVVHVDKQQSGTASIWLEAHNFISTSKSGNAGNGPFIAIQAGGANNQSIGAYAIGWMWGNKKQHAQVTEVKTENVVVPMNITDAQGKSQTINSNITKETKTITPASSTPSFNIGIGIAAMTVQTLGNGLQDGANLPTGETSIRYKSETSFGPIIIASFWF
jgi:hypothetical protein